MKMDLEDLYLVNFVEYYRPLISHGIKFTGFDVELMNRAEHLSSQWKNLFKYSSPDEDVQNITRIIKTTGLSADRVNSLAQPYTSGAHTLKQETVAEKHNLIFLEKKYFKFGSDNDNKANKPTNIAPKSEESSDLSNFSTVFDESESSSILQTNEPTTSLHKPTKKGQEKRKKRQKRNRPTGVNEEITTIPSTDVPANSFGGAPPGVKTTNSRNVRYEINLTKNSNYSLQFRL